MEYIVLKIEEKSTYNQHWMLISKDRFKAWMASQLGWQTRNDGWMDRSTIWNLSCHADLWTRGGFGEVQKMRLNHYYINRDTTAADIFNQLFPKE